MAVTEIGVALVEGGAGHAVKRHYQFVAAALLLPVLVY